MENPWDYNDRYKLIENTKKYQYHGIFVIAEKCVLKLHEMNKNDLGVLHLLGKLYFDFQIYPEAESIFKKIMSIEPDDIIQLRLDDIEDLKKNFTNEYVYCNTRESFYNKPIPEIRDQISDLPEGERVFLQELTNYCQGDLVSHGNDNKNFGLYRRYRIKNGHIETIDIYDHISKDLDRKLSYLPESIGNCTELKNLFISETYLKKIPESIGNCKQLKFVRIKNNKLISLPDSIKYCSNIYQLLINGNNIEDFPYQIYSLTKLKLLDIRYNPYNFDDFKFVNHVLGLGPGKYLEEPNHFGIYILLKWCENKYKQLHPEELIKNEEPQIWTEYKSFQDNLESYYQNLWKELNQYKKNSLYYAMHFIQSYGNAREFENLKGFLEYFERSSNNLKYYINRIPDFKKYRYDSNVWSGPLSIANTPEPLKTKEKFQNSMIYSDARRAYYYHGSKFIPVNNNYQISMRLLLEQAKNINIGTKPISVSGKSKRDKNNLASHELNRNNPKLLKNQKNGVKGPLKFYGISFAIFTLLSLILNIADGLGFLSSISFIIAVFLGIKWYKQMKTEHGDETQKFLSLS